VDHFFENFDVPNSKFECVVFLVIKMFVFKIIVLENYFTILHKYKIDVKLYLLFIILGSFLQVINIDTLILMTLL